MGTCPISGEWVRDCGRTPKMRHVPIKHDGGRRRLESWLFDRKWTTHVEPRSLNPFLVMEAA
jgi:hypothetical protein